MLDMISRRRLEQSIGRLAFSQTIIFVKFDRTQLCPLYQQIHRRMFNSQLSRTSRCTAERMLQLSADFDRRVDVSRPPIADWVIYTDAASKPTAICARFFNGKSRRPELLMGAHPTYLSPGPTCCARPISSTDWGLPTPLAFYGGHAPSIRGSSSWGYLENNNCLSALTRGDSDAAILAALLVRFWLLAQQYDICAMFAIGKSKLSPSDLATRGEGSP